MERSREFFLIKDIIFKSLNKDLKSRFIVNIIDKNFNNIFGNRLKKYLVIEKFFNNKLYIKCKHQGFIQSLYINKAEILNKIDDLFEKKIKINDIILYFKSR